MLTEDADLTDIANKLSGLLVDDWSAVDHTDAATLRTLATDVASARDWYRSQAGTWLSRVRAELADPVVLNGWREFVAHVQAERDEALAHDRTLQAHNVQLPGDAPLTPATIDALRAARDRFAAGKGAGLLARRDVKQALRSSEVDGRPPQSESDIELCLAEAALREVRRRFVTRWSKQAGRVGAPEVSDEHAERHAGRLIDDLRTAVEWNESVWAPLRQRLEQLAINADAEPDEEKLDQLVHTCELLVLRQRQRELVESRARLSRQVDDGAAGPDASRLWEELATALRDRAWARWDSAKDEADRLRALAGDAERLRDLTTRLRSAAPLWTQQIVEACGDVGGPLEHAADAWAWRQAATWLDAHLAGASAAELQRRLEDHERRRLRLTEELVVTLAWRALVDGFCDKHQSALQRFVTASRRLGKGTGKFAGRHQQEIRSALDDAKDAVPVWIMPISRVLSVFRPAHDPPFDVLIVDEASQVGLTDTPVLALASKTIVVGDDQQTSPDNVGLDLAPIHELLDQHLRPVPNYSVLFDPASSLYDMARTKFPDIVMLKEHFRSLPEIIEFSNQRCYGGGIVPLRDRRPSPNWQPLGTVFVRNGVRRASSNVNEPEARAVVDLIEELVADERYAGKTFGVISLLGAKQSPHIQSLLLDRLGPKVLEDRDIRCGEAANFQGDERDVMVLSLVVAFDELGSFRAGAMTKKADIQRINVAASRARDQMWIVHSVSPDDLPAGDPRSELIRHCLEPAVLPETVDRLAGRCESDFERKVLQRILARGYRRVRVQHVVGRYRIDMVVEGPHARLAVECDGDMWHGADRWDQDRARQAVLERSGWTFERIAGSAFYSDPDGALEPLWARLDELGIPTGDWDAEDDAVTARREVSVPVDLASTVEQPPSEQPPSEQAPFERPPQDQQAVPSDHVLPHEPPPRLRLAPDDDADRRSSATDPQPTVAPQRPHHEDTQRGGESNARQRRRSDSQRAARDAPQLAPYSGWWQRRAVISALSATPKELRGTLIEIVAAEGPMHLARAFQLYQQRSGGRRVSAEARAVLLRAAEHAVLTGDLAQIDDMVEDPAQRTVYIPREPAVVVRERGPRDLYDVPRSEVAALIDVLGVRERPPEVAMRAVLSAYGLGKLTDKAASYLSECLDYQTADEVETDAG